MMKMKQGIDVSSWQGVIDWSRVKKQIDFAIIRCGAGHTYDKRFDYNVTSCEKKGIPYGVYWYSKATTPKEAINEANLLLAKIKDKVFKYPVYFDFEEPSIVSKLTKEQASDIANNFCSTLEKAGYYVGIYGSYYLLTSLYEDYITKKFDTWCAQWGDKCKWKNVRMWQHSSTGTIPGINGNVDLDKCYYDYPSVIESARKNNHNRKTEIDVAKEVIAGLWGNGNIRKERIESAGYSYERVQGFVNEWYAVAKDVIRGKYGNGTIRKQNLEKLGYDYVTIQHIVSSIL